jgi:hypothetical protein
MKTSHRISLYRSALFALGCAFLAGFASAPALRAEGDSSQTAAANLPSLPLSASFSKAAGSEDAPYVLTLKNQSGSPVAASAKVLLAVAFHADSKARTVAGQTIGAGESWTISGLAKDDRVIVSADGFAPLVLTVEAQVSADNLPSLPLSASFSKVTGSEDAPYVLTLKNESSTPVKACAKILLAVAFHADSKARMVCNHPVGPGESWTIPGLAKGDRVTVSADGFAPLVLSVE